MREPGPPLRLRYSDLVQGLAQLGKSPAFSDIYSSQELDEIENILFKNLKKIKSVTPFTSSKNYSNCSYTIPELNKFRDELNRWLVPAYGEKLYIDFDYTSISEMQEEMDKVVGQMSQAWWLTPNEKRQAMSYGVEADNEKLNDYYIPANLMPLQDEVIVDDFKSVNVNYDELLDVKREIRQDVFTTASQATQRAEQLGCSGIHSHDENGNAIV